MKKLAFIFVILLLSVFTGFIMPNKNRDFQPSRREQIVNTILSKTARIIKKKYDLNPFGEGAAMPGGHIQELSLDFETKRPYTKEELRGLLIACAQELLNQINLIDEIQPLLKIYTNLPKSV